MYELSDWDCQLNNQFINSQIRKFENLARSALRRRYGIEFPVNLFQFGDKARLARGVLGGLAAGSGALLDVCELGEQRIATRCEALARCTRARRATKRQPHA